MRKLVILISSFLIFSCENRPLIVEDDPEVVISVNSARNDRYWDLKNYKYMVRTQHIVLATNNLYSVGDTLKIRK